MPCAVAPDDAAMDDFRRGQCARPSELTAWADLQARWLMTIDLSCCALVSMLITL